MASQSDELESQASARCINPRLASRSLFLGMTLAVERISTPGFGPHGLGLG
jgi:hypothetical protein